MIHITVAAIIESDNKFLMVEEHCSGQQVINQPAGHLEPGETLVQATIRETLEETTWTFSPDYLVGIYRWVNPDTDDSYLRVALAGQASNPDSSLTLDTGIIQALWLSIQELQAQQQRMRTPLVMKCINDYLAGAKHSLDLLQDCIK
ncbi:Nudix-like NDP and NTP phosphohydrolase NudJ [hydrothermal vent metagenome]|uniref:Phosphatase NudJ n=1 Tax=hydrothermal vent metagenome TaxID=652676 RepID=A0A3B0Y4R2_9ZZZZ